MEILLGAEAAEFQGCKLRKTPGIPNKVSVIDLIAVVTQNINPRKTGADLQQSYPEFVTLTESFKFPGQGQRPSPVADLPTCKQIVLAVLSGSRQSISRKNDTLKAWGLAEFTLARSFVEEETLCPLMTVFAHLAPIKQFPCGPYRIDLYFPQQKIAVECDEHGHQNYNTQDELRRQSFVERCLGCTFFRYNPHEKPFNVFILIAQLMPILTNARCVC